MTAARAMTVSPARRCAYTVVRRVFEDGAYADRALATEAADLDPRERAFATALAYTTVQRRATLDHVLAQLSSRPPDRQDPAVLAALRLGLAQLVLLDGVADHAAVHESVELAKRHNRGAGGFVNAILRRAVREGREILAGLDDATPARAAVLHSVPEWLAQLWFDELGAQEARALLAAGNRPAESALRVNTLVATVAEVVAELEQLGVSSGPEPPLGAAPATTPEPGAGDGLVLGGPFDAHGSPLWRRGAIMPQSRGSMAPARLLGPVAGERVLDLCAAPGAKTSQLAALMADQGTLLAVERNPRRAQALTANLARLHVTCAQVRTLEATTLEADGGYDRVLVDPPCSGLGTLQSRPDLRWKVTPQALAALPDIQLAIVRAGVRALAPGGTLVYSVCTITRAEGEGVIGRLTELAPELTVDAIGHDGPFGRTFPHRDGTDGFFIARLRRSGATTANG